MLRRFDQFQWGPLNATRLNELVDAIMRLRQEVQQLQARPERGKDMILARINGDGNTLKVEENSVAGVAYPFSEVGLAITPDGAVDATAQVSYENIPGGIDSASGAVLIAFEEAPTMNRGDVVIAHYAPMIVAHTGGAKRVVYMVKTMPRPSIDLYTVVGEAVGTGRYVVVRANSPAQSEEEIENIYETSSYYGALDEPQNECAELQPRRLRTGDQVFGFRVGTFLYTCAPTAFTVACQDCGSNPVTANAVAQSSAAADLLSAEMLLRG